METQAYYISKLQQHLCQKQRENPSYSMRAYARDVGIHPSTLSQILKGKRPLPYKDTPTLVKRLNLDPKERTRFLESVLRTKTSLDEIKIAALDERFIIDESNYSVIAEWEHYVVLDLFEVKGFKANSDHVSKRLGITEVRADVVLRNLVTAGLLEITKSGELKRVHDDVKTTEDIASRALRDSHKENLRLAAEKLDAIDVELRDFSAATFAVDLEKLPEAKTIIREFRMKMAALLKSGEKTDVYQLAIQFYPMTDLKESRQ